MTDRASDTDLNGQSTRSHAVLFTVRPDGRMTGRFGGSDLKESPIPSHRRPGASRLRSPRRRPLILLESGAYPAYAWFFVHAATP